MDPQLTKQLIRRRLILEKSLDISVKNENKTKSVEVTTISATDDVLSNNIKNNFLEKIKKFESLGDNQVNITYQNIIDKPRANITEIAVNKLNKDSVALKKNLVNSKLEVDCSFKDLCIDNKQKQDEFHEKIKQFESSIVFENDILKIKKNNSKERTKKSNVSNKTSSSKCSSKSDYNNWELDESWVFCTEYLNSVDKKNQVQKSKLLRRKKKSTGIVHNPTDSIFSRN